MLGVAGTRLKYVQKITPLCGSLNKDGSVKTISPLDPSAVPATAMGFSLKCGNGKVVTGIDVAYHSNTTTYPYLGSVAVECKSWTLSQWSGAYTVVSLSNFGGWPVKARVECMRQTQPARALRVRGTTSVKALGIVCDEP
jgi:hypothetical protein